MNLKIENKKTNGMDVLIKSNQGFIAGEFIFALTLSAGFSLLLFALTYTLGMIEVSQYVAYSMSRAHMASHLDEDQQKIQAEKKFKQLINGKVLKPLFSEEGVGWFTLTNPEIRGGIGAENSATFDGDYAVDSTLLSHTGVRLSFNSKILNFRIPFIGKTAIDDDHGFSTRITAFLFREPSVKDCVTQMADRYRRIIELDQRFKKLAGQNPEKYIPLEDNGC
ncbi:MAG TPA: hypothetical protein PLJ21_07420 [Pseudobdellovibrionaceae bacterium]|nr:hypothetical protein [Pseudobdellovibrionaceae bacterium]